MRFWAKSRVVAEVKIELFKFIILNAEANEINGNHNAETYYEVGDALGRAMAEQHMRNSTLDWGLSE